MLQAGLSAGASPEPRMGTAGTAEIDPHQFSLNIHCK
jgi:hypothetical protein